MRAPEGQRGFHSAWYGQSGALTLCVGERGRASVSLLNAGSRDWSLAHVDTAVYLGTWGPDPGQDQPTRLGGDGTHGSPNTNWPGFNRVAAQSAAVVAPGQVTRFEFTVVAPQQPGSYRLNLRPLIDGVQWLQDEGITVFVFVVGADDVVPAADRPITASLATPAPINATRPLPLSSFVAPATARPPAVGAQPPPGAVLIPNYSNGTGYSVQCADGTWSKSGGKSGACSHHGGVRRGR
jgi:hypothetical protein